ncbi:MAG: hypothetical protein WC761_02170 [Candidatus Paceibacterota bacterium]|jgi:hypothetical protein
MSPTVKHPIIGKLLQYKQEHYGKIIPTNYPKSYKPDLRWDAYMHPYTSTVGYLYAPYVPLIMSPAPYPAPVPQVAYQPNLFPNGFEEVREPSCDGQIPWKYGMPWTYYRKVSLEHTFGTKRSDYYAYTNERPKYTVMPLEAISFDAIIKGCKKVLGSVTYLRAYIINPNDASQEIPDSVWIKEEWLEPHSGREYQVEGEEAVKSRLTDKLAAIKAKRNS